MNTNIRTKVINDTNELIFKNKDLLVDNSPDSDTTAVDDVTVTIVQPKDTKYTILVYIMEYRRSNEDEIFEADTDEGHKETFKTTKGSIYLVVLLDNSTNSTSTDYYRLNTSSRGKLTRDITIKFKDDSPAPNAVITIVQTDNQTIHVYTPQKSGGTDYTSSFTCPIGTTYEVEVIANSGYIAGTPNTKSGTFNSNMTINANPAALATATITIAQSDNQTIHVYTPQKSGGTDHTSTFVCPVGTTYEVEVIADTGYIAGIPNTTKGTFNNDVTINATDAIKPQIFIAKGSAPWYNHNKQSGSDNNYQWPDKNKVINTDESVSGQATVACKDVTNMVNMFSWCQSITSLDLSNFYTSNVTNMDSAFNYCNKLASLNLTNFDTSNAYNMSQMFNDCSKLTSLDVSNFDTSKVTNMMQMFSRCTNLTSLDLSNFNTSKVTNMGIMFAFCSNLTSLDVSNFDTSNVTIMNGMFSGCFKLTSLDLSNFNTSKVTDMANMLSNCINLTKLDLSSFNTSNVTNMTYMFDHCSNLTSLDLSSFNTSNVTNISWMFYNCSNLTTIKGIIDMKSCTKYENMFYNCPKLTGVKIKNPPSGFNGAGLTSSQYTIVS